MRSTVTVLIGVLCIAMTASAQTWNIVWSDEFDGPSINSSNWTYDLGAGGWGNNELQYYTNRPVNATISNGALLIIARKESYQGSAYTSARLKTQNLRSFTYGRVEGRIKLPAGQGLWPAFWILGNSITQVGWPKCGEIDIMEHVNTASVVNGTMHWDNNGHAQYGGTTPCAVTQYHIYSIEWNATAIKWFVDGAKYWEGSIANNINSTDEFHSPFFIIMNLAVGGNWPGNPDATTPFPDTVSVDYVRVYQLSTGVKEGANETPDHSALFQNYPNPFNPKTTMEYAIAGTRGQGLGTSDVTLVVYDISGREVAVLVNERKAPGKYEVAFDATGLASGVYVYKLIADRSVTTRKLVLLR